MSWLKPIEGGVELTLYVQPRAPKTRPVGEHGDALKIQVAAPPVEGEANAELIRWLAKTFGIPRGQVELLSGDTSRHKRFRLHGVNESVARTVMTGSK